MKLQALFAAALSLLPAFGQAVGGTGFNRAPAGVDEALRARVLEFYGLEQAGRFRQAEGLVCQESKDRYYDMEKRRWTSVEIIQTSYEEDFKKARATVALGTTLSTFSGPVPVKAPMTSLWNLENGAWCRYIPEPSRDGVPSPFGTMKPASGAEGSTSPFAGGPPPLPADQKQLEAMVRLSKTEVALSPGGGTETVEVHNGMPGNVELKVICPGVVGLQCELSAAAVPTNGRASLVLKFSPLPDKYRPPMADVRLVVEPLGFTKTIRVRFQ
jgi:hypothetical protein